MSRRFIENDGGDNDFEFSSASDDNGNYKISNVIAADAHELKEKMKDHESL